MKKILLLILAGYTTSIFAMDKAEFISLLKKNHPFFQVQNGIQDNLIIDIDIASSYTDWQFISKINTSSNAKESISLVNSFNKTTINGREINISNNIIRNDILSNSYNNSLALKYIIPLQKNQSGVNSKLALNLAKIKQKIGDIQILIDKNKFINNGLKKLWKMKFLEQKVSIIKEKIKNEKKQLKLIKQKFEQNLVDKSDVLLQENNYQNQSITLITTEQELQSIQQELQALINTKITHNSLKLTTIKQVINTLNINSVSAIKIMDLQKSLIYRELKSLNNQHKQQVDLNLGANITKSSSAIFADGVSNNSINIGLTIALPLKNSKNNSLIAQKENKLAILNNNKKQKIIEINISNYLILAQLKSLKKIIIINKKQLILNKEKAQEFEKMYNNSNTELRFVIDSQSKEQTANLNYYANLLTYKILQLDYQSLIY